MNNSVKLVVCGKCWHSRDAHITLFEKPECLEEDCQCSGWEDGNLFDNPQIATLMDKLREYVWQKRIEKEHEQNQGET